MFTFSDDERYFHDNITITHGISILSYVLGEGRIYYYCYYYYY